MQKFFNGIYKNKKVLVTGHTGFKGSWLSLWLKKMGADVIGYSLKAPTNPNHFELLNLGITSIIGDIRDLKSLNKTFKKHKIDIVFHLAAQPLVRYSYKYPIKTYETNVLGTLNVLEACKRAKIKAIVNITSDKAYENIEQLRGYKEEDKLGGYDPYSSSKACADILASSYTNSYFNLKEYKQTHNTLLATCRAGNVIGGGDWGKDRLLTDIVTSISKDKVVTLRNPNSIRPWQYVLEPLSGYLLIGQKLLEERKEFATSWNFGPNEDESLSVEEVVKSAVKYWDKLEYEVVQTKEQPHEANFLKLNCEKAKKALKYTNIFNSKEAIQTTINWYKNYYEKGKISTSKDLKEFIVKAKEKDAVWTKS